MRVKYAPRALEDMRAIFAYIYARNPSAARRVRGHIKQTAIRIAEMPGKGVRLKQRSGVRRLELARYPYAIYYTIANNAAVILHVRHGARKPPKAKEL